MMAATFRVVFIECPIDFRTYILLIRRHLASRGSIDNDEYHHNLFRDSHICAMFKYNLGEPRQSMLNVAKLLPDARSMDLSIRADKLEDIDSLIANRPSLTHLRLCWPHFDDPVPLS
jgi:hypothetical protein